MRYEYSMGGVNYQGNYCLEVYIGVLESVMLRHIM